MIAAIGVSNMTPPQVAEARGIAPVACVQDMYNRAHWNDDALAADGIAYVPIFPLRGSNQPQSAELSHVAERLGATPIQSALACFCGARLTSC